MHGFVTEPWHSRHGLFSCERAASSMLEPCAISSACLVSCWSVVFGSWHSCLEFPFRVGVRTLVLHVLSLSLLGRVLFYPRVLCCTQFLFYQAGLSCYVLCCVAPAFVFHWLRAFMLSCLVWTHGLWVFSLATRSCPVLHMACDLFAGHVLVFSFCVSTWLLS